MNEFSEGKETATLVMGILSLVFGCGIIGLVFAIIGLVFSSQAKKAGVESGKVKGGKICSIIGLVLGIIALIIMIVSGAGIFAAFLGSSSSYYMIAL